MVTRKRPAPFTTSTLQQEANSRFGLGSSQTMKLAQVRCRLCILINVYIWVCVCDRVYWLLLHHPNIKQPPQPRKQELYEEGFISYMRTDSPNMGPEAMAVAHAQVR
jgi:reverse gyrase